MNAVLTNVEQAAGEIAQKLLERAGDVWTDFVDSYGNIWINEDAEFEKAFYGVLGDDAPDDLYMTLIHHPTVEEAFKEMKVLVKDAAEIQSYRDYEPYDRIRRPDTLYSLGMSCRDFV